MMATDARRPSDDDPPNRQSLPSISEVISGARPGPYPQPAIPPPPGVGLPSPFSQPSAHQYSEADKHASPFPPRQDGLFDSPRPPFSSSRHSLPPVSDRRATPPTKTELPPPHGPKQQQPQPPQPPPPEGHTTNGTYSHPPPPPPPPPPSGPTSHPYQPGQLPSGQVSLPSYPISPRHSVPVPPGHYDPRAQADEADFASRARYEAPHNRHFETWSYQDSLSRIGSSSRTIYTFAEAYTRIAREQHGSQPIPERLPTEREVVEMLVNVDLIKRSLDQVKDAIQASIQSERAREGAKIKSSPYEEDHDVAMYGDVMKPQYAMQHEVKKRRGRAAPPGRCHSCNRIDTPEWRRGPDGARTLCNACGLHYAKLERKRQLEARSIRPKPEDRS
ncbi:hypothetical protein CDD80_1583 [Ophiocordyceps camponoti-rufipedis]|uniref:GATA-type domain-containing protein n=1 Tax=Ophiocordyceps camponoti-rufipedis TaxID=2004952 RepID=A0A2C5XVP2_9HYPO|nr:hypothetical protein CDD80_1583 [Ophiocordyceps camponoti-rufipedis]